MNNLGQSTKAERHPDAAFRVVDGVALIVMPSSAKIFTLNAVGTRVWELLEGRTAGQIAEKLTVEFSVRYDDALADTLSFLEGLQSRQMISVNSENP